MGSFDWPGNCSREMTEGASGFNSHPNNLRFHPYYFLLPRNTLSFPPPRGLLQDTHSQMAEEGKPSSSTSQEPTYEPKSTLQYGSAVGLQAAGVGAVVSAVQNALGSHSAGAAGFFTRTGSTIGMFGMS